ncbi:cysteine proteinase [Hesseltinella vesiculosa]|uniref:ubiquitinyl hydrolase 1 n=1 Tax=Hesseltinella vesiculosa TaxID=101127 RepID=A0A1X2GN41_9FUNG|nr:cysteine proteinase [Hesseltinella vesiculosa]
MAPPKVLKPKQLTQNTIDSLLHRSVVFVPSRYVDPKLELFKQKYAPVNSTTQSPLSTSSAQPAQTQTAHDHIDPFGFELPIKILFDPTRLDPVWTTIRTMGATLTIDHDHSSALKAVLNCITYTPTLANYLSSKWHSANCTVQEECMVCALENHVKQVMANPGRQISPRQFIGKLKRMKQGHGSSKNAHDVWRFFIDQLQHYLLLEKGHKDKRVQQTTAIYQMYHGFIQDRIECQECKESQPAYQYQGFLDLFLDIHQASQLDKCISHQFAKGRAMQWDDCPRCQKQTRAKLYQSMYQPPRVLALHLNRFDKHGNKNEKSIKFSDILDLSRWVTPSQSIDTNYQLCAMIVHQGGNSIHAGRFVAYVKGSNGAWYCLDGDSLQQVTGKRVTEQKASMLFYIPLKKFVPAKQSKQSARQPLSTTTEPEPTASSPPPTSPPVSPLEPSEDQSEEEDDGNDNNQVADMPARKIQENANAIVVQHDDSMELKRNKLTSLIQLESKESKSLQAKHSLMTKTTGGQFHQEISGWDAPQEDEDTGVIQKSRAKTLKGLKTKRAKVDQHDMDYDRGKVKKIKKQKRDRFSQANLFQIEADYKRK